MKKPTTTSGKLIVCGAICLVAVFITSCASTKGVKPCAENKKAHMPFITCQPMDIIVQLPAPGDPPKTAAFSVKATGKNLTYLWYAKKRKSPEFEAVNGATGPQLTINGVQDTDFGLYFCAVGSEADDGSVSIVTSRYAGLGGVPAGSGGVFIPCDWPVMAGTGGNICIPPQPVSGYTDRFPTNEVPSTGQTALKCQIINKSATPNVAIDNTDYYLQWFVTSMNNGCMTNLPGTTTWVAYTVTPGLTYHLTAFFKIGHVPAAGTVLELQGVYLP
jgi:hypothetical protein